MTLENILSITFFIIGSCFGSFLSVLTHRLLKGEKGIIKGRSHCPHCRKTLKPINLIPIFSWIFQRGKCSYCHKEISITYPTLELVTGLLFLTNFNMLLSPLSFDFSNTIQMDWIFWVKVLYLNLISLNLLAIFFTDLREQLIPDILLYSLITLTIPAIFLVNGELATLLPDRGLSIAVALAFFGGQYLISKGKWLGSGDIYIAIGMALLLGFSKIILAIALSYIIGSIIAIILLANKKLRTKQTIPFAPFLIMGTLIALYAGNNLISWYFSNFLYL